MCCINQYKNTNLKANHNQHCIFNNTTSAVSTNTKIQIWKQITTIGVESVERVSLYQPIQKYKFESKSQPTARWLCRCSCCINQYKNTNLKANHNVIDVWAQRTPAVSTNTKIQIWKQITTCSCEVWKTSELYQPIQKYKFESKSQPSLLFTANSSCCINQYKNTNLKANHNLAAKVPKFLLAVSTNTKIQIWKQITTPLRFEKLPNGLYQPIQKYKFESKSQQGCRGNRPGTGCINQYKNTNLKANHN